MSKYMIVNITWNGKGWEDISHDKSNFAWVKTHPRSTPGESWNFSFSHNSKTKRGFFQVRHNCQPKKYENGGIIFFFSRNNYENKNYLVGMYANSKYHVNMGNGNIVAPTKYCLKFYKYVQFDRRHHLPPKRHRIPQVGYTYITENNARNIIRDALLINSTINGIEENSDPKSDFLKLARISRSYFKEMPIPQFRIYDKNSVKLDDFIEKEFPNFSSDDRITIVKDNAKLKRSYSRHQDLLNRAINTLQEKGWRNLRISSDADLLAYKGHTLIILEAKSITSKNTRSQIRNAVSQLYQYSYELDLKGYKKQRLVLLLEKRSDEYWFDLCEY